MLLEQQPAGPIKSTSRYSSLEFDPFEATTTQSPVAAVNSGTVSRRLSHKQQEHALIKTTHNYGPAIHNGLLDDPQIGSVFADNIAQATGAGPSTLITSHYVSQDNPQTSLASCSSASLTNCSDSNQSVLKICPEELNFADLGELWIQKDLAAILMRVSIVAPIVLLGIVGNLTIIYSMYKFKPFRTKPTNIFILNMAIADLLTTIVCPNAALFTDIYQFYVLGPFICRFEGFVKGELLRFHLL